MGGSARTVLDQAPLQQNRNLQVCKRVSFPGNVMSILVVLQTPFMHHKFTARVVLLGWHDGWSVAKTKLNSFCICAWRGSPATGLHTTLKNAWITFSAKRNFVKTIKHDHVAILLIQKPLFRSRSTKRIFYVTREIRTEKTCLLVSDNSKNHIIYPGKRYQCPAQRSVANSSISALVPVGSLLPVSEIDSLGADAHVQHVQQSYQNVRRRSSTFQRKSRGTLTPDLWEYWHKKVSKSYKSEWMFSCNSPSPLDIVLGYHRRSSSTHSQGLCVAEAYFPDDIGQCLYCLAQ